MERTEYSWERLPEVIASQEYGRCVGRVLASLPRRLARRSIRPLTSAAVRLGAGIVGCNLDVPPGHELSAEERAEFWQQATEALDESRRLMEALRRRGKGDQDEVLRALEALDRTEMWMRAPSTDAAVH